MTQYIILIHGNATQAIPPESWNVFFKLAEQSGLFRGGSEIGRGEIMGAPASSSDHIAGFMRFDAETKAPLVELLKAHPVVLHGGSIELCEMPLTT